MVVTYLQRSGEASEDAIFGEWACLFHFGNVRSIMCFGRTKEEAYDNTQKYLLSGKVRMFKRK